MKRHLSTHHKIGYLLLITLIITLMTFIWRLGPYPQDLDYHDFADGRRFLFIPNALNVLSNLGFIWVGLWGLRRARNIKDGDATHSALALLCTGACLIGLGSGYYHWSPSNSSLIWDRLPMALTFVALFSQVIASFISKVWGQRLLLPFIALGLGSVLYWAYTEQVGAGDLRFYALVQFTPLLAIPVILVCFRQSSRPISHYIWLLLSYLLAKLAESFDQPLLEITGVISGHSLKHLLAAIGLYCLFRGLTKPVESSHQSN